VSEQSARSEASGISRADCRSFEAHGGHYVTRMIEDMAPK
jgi:hypothetical protein